MTSRQRTLVLCSIILHAGAGIEVGHSWTNRKGETARARLSSGAVKSDLCDPSVKSSSGYYDINEGSAAYFYWFFESRSKPAQDPLVIWLTGGPGCSSTLALLGENGPCSVKDDGSGTTTNPYSWNNNANILWIDQPVGVGFSYGRRRDYISTEEEVGENLYWFLQAFFKANRRYQLHEFYIFGESYGGHYVPTVANRVYQGNKNRDGLHINLKGIGIGNGLTNSEIQYKWYPQMAYNNTFGIQAVDEATYQSMLEAVPRCVALIHSCQRERAYYACNIAQTFCDARIVSKFLESGLNVYDVRVPCGEADLCYDFSHVEKWLNTPEVQEALHVSPRAADWQSCNMRVNRDFSADFCKNYDELLPPLLEDGIRVLIYAGNADFICNHFGNLAWTLEMPWKGKDAYVAAPEEDWLLESGKQAGQVKAAGELTFLRVFDAGHMVPMDQPEAALALLNTFISGGDFTFPAPVNTMEEAAQSQYLRVQ